MSSQLNQNMVVDGAKVGYIVTHARWDIAARFKQLVKYLGPAFIVSVAYIDPGNFATNISGGSIFNYNLLWVILCSNLMAIFLQTLSAKLGIATGKDLPAMCREVFSSNTNKFLWVVAVIAAMATYVAEFMGCSLGLYLLFQIPLLYAGFITIALTVAIIHLRKYGQRVVEAVISVLVAVICVAYGIELFLAKPEWSQVALHTVVPSLPNGQAVLIAVGMLGATVMPHVIYLHSQLVQTRRNFDSDSQKLKHYKLAKIDIVIAMNIAFLVNAAMVIVSAAVFFKEGIVVESIEQAHQTLRPLLGSLSSGAFGIALLASGLSSSAVGALAGETIMDGFVNFKLPRFLTRTIIMVPSLIILFLGINPIKVLVLSQVSLSFALPGAIIPMMIITSKKNIMGALTNKKSTNLAGWLISATIIILNGMLLYLTFTGNI